LFLLNLSRNRLHLNYEFVNGLPFAYLQTWVLVSVFGYHGPANFEFSQFSTVIYKFSFGFCFPIVQHHRRVQSVQIVYPTPIQSGHPLIGLKVHYLVWFRIASINCCWLKPLLSDPITNRSQIEIISGTIKNRN
jgi:hypothetical protein